MNVNVLQSVNSFMGQFGLAVSSPKQILAKVTTVALAAILLAGNLPSVSADCLTDCVNKCPDRRIDPDGYSKCAQACFSKCLGG
ncbi:MAG: hypothetical protein ACRDAI_06895 [Candidatus Rhabdochlamydia sp.]